MARTVKIKKADNYTYEINSKTADTNYVFANEAYAGVSTLNFSNLGGEDLTYIKDNNDLLIFIKFGDYTNYKLSVTRIKDYYLYCGVNNNLVCVNSASVYTDANSNAYSYVKKTFTDSASAENIFSNVGATIYNISNSKDKTEIRDIAGSDKYYVNGLSPNTAPVHVIDELGNDYYEITNSRGLEVDDYKGSDKYVIKNCDQLKSADSVDDDSLKTDLWICDYAGNDSYTFDNVKVTNSVECKTHDLFGNDRYNLNNTTYMYLEERNGNDKYIANESHHFRIADSNGNDSYTITNSDTVTIADSENGYRHARGNDRYTVTSCSNVNINDQQGGDRYTFYDCDNVDIDDSEGRDNYTMSYITTKLKILDKHSENDNYTITNATNVNIDDRGGREAYRLTNVHNATIVDSDADGINGNDIMTVSNSNAINITNKHGNVRYAFTNTSDIDITDKTGKDTYIISGLYDRKTKTTTFATNVKITDEAAHVDDNHNDVFNFNYVKGSDTAWATYLASDNWTISESGGSNTYNIKQSENIKIHSSNGNRKDTYNITSCKNVYLLDEGSVSAEIGSSDVYNIKFAQNTAVTIRDKGGAKDKLTVSGLSKKNVVLMSNYNNNSLIIFDTKSRSYVQVEDFYQDNGSGSYSSTLFGNGAIETISAGGTVKATDSATIDKLNNIKAQVTAFLGGDSVVDVLNGNNENRIQDLVTLYMNQA